LFVGVSSFVAGAVAKHFGYSSAFVLAALALAAAAVAGRYVFTKEVTSVDPVEVEVRDECLTG
jgi:hypothetical protein